MNELWTFSIFSLHNELNLNMHKEIYPLHTTINLTRISLCKFRFNSFQNSSKFGEHFFTYINCYFWHWCICTRAVLQRNSATWKVRVIYSWSWLNSTTFRNYPNNIKVTVIGSRLDNICDMVSCGMTRWAISGFR